jgi:hypothetical protein
MRIISIILIIIGIIFGLLGVRSYLRDKSYEEASIAVKASVISAEVKPMSGKAVASIHIYLSYMRDGVADSIKYNFSEVYSDKDPLPTEEELKAAPPYVRYVPEEKRSKTIPNWVMVSSNGEFDGLYGRSLFGQMFTFILLGLMVSIFGRKRLNKMPASNTIG